MPSWQGRHKILNSKTTLAHDINLFTDESGTLGFGIYFDGKWISQRWPAEKLAHSIQWKELFPIWVACLLWSKQFTGKRLLFHCDNMSVVNIWSTKSSRCPQVMVLLRKLFFLAATDHFTVDVSHIPGIDNHIADSLSRLQIPAFFNLAPDADPLPTPVPAAAWQC